MPQPDVFGLIRGFGIGPKPPVQTEVAPGIEKTPGVCGGSACVSGTRISVWVLESFRRLGATDADLLHNYPSLTLTHLAQAAAYVHANPAEIDAETQENDEA
ncbi:MAG TPA: DUF433 domain-containing protein [Urbifossiella sp.]|jgi:uncharacterized protein (DUF433 family)|nr:DUF433 domain-containing protein [Urbifossiella sp.]